MPKIVDEMPESGRSDYNFSQYTDGKAREFKQGDDFQVKPVSFAQTAKAWAKKNGYNKTSVVTKKTSVFIKFAK